MHKTLDYTKTGGLWFTQDVAAFMQQGYAEALDGLAGLIGDKTVIKGVNNIGGNVSDGWISFNGEILPFVGGALSTYVDVETAITKEQYDDSFQKDFYNTKRLKMVSVATATSFLFSDLVRPGTIRSMWQKGDIKEIDCDMAYYAANFDGTGLGINERAGWCVCGTNGTKARGGKVAVGFDPLDSDFDDFTKTGGFKLHTLLASEIPLHKHVLKYKLNLTSGSSGNKIAQLNAAGAAGTDGGNGDNFGSYQTESQTGGGGNAHNNMQPYIVSLFIQKL